jgi:hypothetical protein
VRQSCSCHAAHRALPSAESRSDLYCHCTICQAFNGRPFADVTAFPARAIALPEESAVTFRRYRPPPSFERGSCPACGGPVVEVMTLGPLKTCAFAPSQNFERTSEPPKPSVHIFYHRRVADVIDSLPKVTGYWASQMAVSRLISASAFRFNRRWPA